MTDTGEVTVAIRAAEAADAPAIAALHAASWRAHYRGAFSDSYLDGPVEAERLAVWTRRLAEPRADMIVRLASEGDGLLGFVCLFVDHDPEHGSLIDNLHVAASRKGQGIGQVLMHAAGLALRGVRPVRPLHLFVLEPNRAARGFYDRIGGRVTGHETHPGPEGSDNPVLRYGWADAAALIEATDRAGRAAAP